MRMSCIHHPRALVAAPAETKMPSFPPQLSFTLLLVTWWFTNNVFAIDAELLFHRFKSPLLYVDLTITQTVFGIVVTTFYTRSLPPKTPRRAPWSVTLLTVGSLHFLGSLLTNLSYSRIGATSTLMWKLTEPLSAVCLKRLVLAETTSPTSILGVVITLSGVLLFSKSSFTLPNFSPIILSNVVFPTRNVFIKLSQRDPDLPSDARFLNMLLASLPLCAASFLLKLLAVGGNIPALGYMLRNAILFNAYQISSFLLLERLDPLTHSLLNTLKRFTGILLSMAVIRAPMQAFHYQGIGLTVVGFGVYLGGGGKRYKLANYGFAAGIVVGMIAMLIVGGTVGDMLTSAEVREVTLTSDANQTQANTLNYVNNVSNLTAKEDFSLDVEPPKPGYVVMTDHEYHRMRRSTRYHTYDDALLWDGGNVGNLVWQYGAHEKVPDFNSVTRCTNKGTRNCQKVAEQLGKKVVHYLPMANMLNPAQPNNFMYTADALRRRIIDGILVVGLGIQVEFRANSSDPEFNSRARIETSSDEYPTPPMTKKFFDAMREYEGRMLLRGDFTYRMALGEGFQGGFSVGCPSLFINEDVRLGRNLQRRYRDIAERIGDKSLRIAVSVKKMRGFEKQMVHLLHNYPNSRFYAQSLGDLNMLKHYKIPFHRARFFTNVEDWMADLRQMDVSYGVRIHGNMISLGAGLPVVVVASDWRVLELVQVMKIPYFTTYDAVFDDDIDVAKLVKLQVPRFDGEAFDRNRCKIAKVYVKVLWRYGLEVREHIKRISQLC